MILLRSVVLPLVMTAVLFSMVPAAFAAKSWGVTNEEKAKFSGQVVDIHCHLTANCPDNCGDGKRQLGLLTDDQGLVLVAKNLTLYTGASYELSEFCGQQVEVDGLFTANKGIKFFQVQNLRPADGKWKKAKRFLQVWAEENNTKPRKAKKWYRKDPRVKAIVARDGRLGLGAEADAAYFK